MVGFAGSEHAAFHASSNACRARERVYVGRDRRKQKQIIIYQSIRKAGPDPRVNSMHGPNQYDTTKYASLLTSLFLERLV